jgi:hypothetical protein
MKKTWRISFCSQTDEAMQAAEDCGYRFEELPEQLRWDYVITATFDEEQFLESVSWTRSDGATSETDPDSWNVGGVHARTWAQNRHFDEMAALRGRRRI